MIKLAFYNSSCPIICLYKIISILISKSKDIGLKNIFIETGSGSFFEPARKLFKSCGFKECDPFSHYKNDPNSCFMKISV